MYDRDGVIFSKCSIAGKSEKEKDERRGGKEPQKGRRRPRKKKGKTGKKEDLYKCVKRVGAGATTRSGLRTSSSGVKGACAFPLSSADSYESSYQTFPATAQWSTNGVERSKWESCDDSETGRDGWATRSPHSKRWANSPQRGGQLSEERGEEVKQAYITIQSLGCVFRSFMVSWRLIWRRGRLRMCLARDGATCAGRRRLVGLLRRCYR